jgi:hypothetical protein
VVIGERLLDIFDSGAFCKSHVGRGIGSIIEKKQLKNTNTPTHTETATIKLQKPNQMAQTAQYFS